MEIASRKLKQEIGMSTDFALCRKGCRRDANRGFVQSQALSRAVVRHMNCSVERNFAGTIRGTAGPGSNSQISMNAHVADTSRPQCFPGAVERARECHCLEFRPVQRIV